MPSLPTGLIYSIIQKLTALTAAIVLLITSLPSHTTADATSPWLAAGNPSLKEVGQYPPGHIFPTLITGKECFYGKVVTRPSKPGQSEQSHTGCLTKLPYGSYSESHYLYLNGTSVAGKLESYFNTGGSIAVPNSATVINSTGSSLEFTKNMFGSLKSTVHSDGSVSYKISRPADGYLRDKAGNNLPYQYDTINFSENGRWMVVDSPGKAMLRVNLETFEILPFRAPFVYGSGFHPGTQATITNDGRYVFVRSISSFEVFDLSTCGEVPDAITGPVNCSSKRLLEFVRAQLGNRANPPARMSFVDENTLSMVIRYGQSDPQVLGKFILTPNESFQPSQLQYLALGDSFASGEGAYMYEQGTDTKENNCHLSAKSYPYLIDQDLDLNSFRSIACSGARMEHITTKYQISSVPDPNPLGKWLPGQYAQYLHVIWSQPSVITVSISGNDIGFGHKVGVCVFLPNTCYNNYKSRKALVEEINSQHSKLKDTYQLIKSKAAPSAKVYVVGYPKLAKSGGNCAANVKLNKDEIELSNKIVDHLNYVIHQASLAAGVRYIDVADVFYGHRLCERSGNLALHGFSLGKATPYPPLGPSAKESYHPNELGHSLLRTKILQATNNFTLANPDPATVTPPTINSPTAQALLEGFIDDGSSTSSARYDETVSDNVAYRGSSHNVRVDGMDHGLKSNSSYTAEIHSDPINIGTFNADDQGSLDFNFTVPSSIEPGYHTLHILGQNSSGEPIDIYKGIYIGASEDDFDGDGMPNDKEACLLVEPAGVDEDEDGRDDACDGFIDFAPSKVSQLYRVRNESDTNQILVERNVQIGKEFFGISDYDPDNDGWSIVSESDNLTHYPVANSFVEDDGLSTELTARFIPYVWVRHPEKGCTKLTPQQLGEVNAYSERRLAVVAEDTDGCRKELPSEDVDKNGAPDELQTLYRARNGDVLKGEDPYKLYIERNLVAAEAVLGQSDYDADNDGWALVAVSPQILTAQYNRILLVDSANNILSSNGSFTSSMLGSLDQASRKQVTPVVLYRKLFLQCEAIKPISLSTVKLNEATSRGTIVVNGYDEKCK